MQAERFQMNSRESTLQNPEFQQRRYIKHKRLKKFSKLYLIIMHPITKPRDVAPVIISVLVSITGSSIQLS